MEIFEERTVVKKILPPEKTKEEHEHDFNLFLTHFKLLLKNEDLIIRTPEYFHVLLERLLIGSTITGASFIPLGVLLSLWKEGKLLCRCLQCDNKSYIFQAGGSLLSGSNSYSAICPECEDVFHGSVSSFSKIYFPLLNKIKKNPNTRTINIRRTQKFSWSKGLVGQPTPDEILKDGTYAIEFKSFIKLLVEKMENDGG